MEAVVDVGLVVSAAVVFLDDRPERLVADFLGCEGNDSRVTASQGGTGSRKPFIATRSVVLVEVYVTVDASRGYISAFGVDNVRRWLSLCGCVCSRGRWS